MGEQVMAYTILVVDDSRVVRERTRDYCERLGHSVEVCADGESAVELFRRGRRFDLVLLDVYMPGADGLQVLEEIVRIAPGQKVVFMTSDRDSELFEKTSSLLVDKAYGFINKPFSLTVLSDCIKTVLALNGRFTHKKEGFY